MTILVSLGALFFIWLVILSWIVIRSRTKYERMFAGSSKEKLDELLSEFVGVQKKSEAELQTLKKELERLTGVQKLSLQKVGFVRFNPFERSSGEQSFVLSLLNIHNTGVVINFIYTRDGVRVYCKLVKEGKGVHLTLSEEEIEAIKKAI